MSEDTPVGKTRTQGWEVGVRRTIPIRTDHTWNLLMTQPGLGVWLGQGVAAEAFRKGARFTTDEGTLVEVRSYVEGSLLRMRWQPRDWDSVSVLQIRVQPAKTGATLSFHHEQLQNGDQRELMRSHWAAVIAELGKQAEAN